MPSQELRYAIGVDLGGTKIELGIIDERGQIHEHDRLETLVDKGPLVVEEQILKRIELFRQESNIPLLGIGIGVAGQIESKTGVVTFAPNLKWHQVPLQDNLQKALKLPVCVVNDVRAITLGEWLYGAGKNVQDLLCVFIGTGIGSGIVSGGRLLTGSSNTFGEVGHMTIDFQGPLCTCGKRGCLEAIAGGWGIAARAQDAIKADNLGDASQGLLNLAGGDLHAITAKVVVEAYDQKDPLAIALMQQVQNALMAGFASLINLYNPQRLILGGGFIDGMPEMVAIIEEGIKKGALKAATHSLEVVKAQLGKEAGVVGAAAAIFEKLQKKELKQ